MSEQGTPLFAISPRGSGALRSSAVESTVGRIPLYGIARRLVMSGNTVEYLPLEANASPLENEAARFTSDRDFSEFEESPAQTLMKMAREKVASPLIMFEPPRAHCIVPITTNRRIVVNNTERDGRLLQSQHLAMLASGKRPYFGRDHADGAAVSGYPVAVYWRPQTGIAAIVDWTPETDRQVVSGEYHAFSSEVIYNGKEKMGIGLRCGTLVHRSKESAFGKHYCRVSPVTKLKAMHTLADEFLRFADRRAVELSAAGVSEPTLNAFEQLKRCYPKLHAAYSLRKALQREIGHEALLKFG